MRLHIASPRWLFHGPAVLLLPLVASFGGCRSKGSSPGEPSSCSGVCPDGGGALDGGGTDGTAHEGAGGPRDGDVDGDSDLGACRPSAIVDMNAKGTLTGTTTDYVGDNLDVDFDGQVQSPTCVFGVAYPVVLRYVPRTSGQLVVSLANPGTPPALDTVAWSLDHCMAAGATTLACNDNDAVTGHDLASVLTVPQATANVPIYVVVAGNTGLRPPSRGAWDVTGPFEITVTEMPVVDALGASCDPTRLANICSPDAACTTLPQTLLDGGTSGPTCIAGGSLGGACRTSGTQCNSGLACEPNSGTCLTAAPLGAPCFDGKHACEAPNECVGQTGFACAAPGSLNASCKATGVPCDSGLVCAGGKTVTDPASACLPTGETAASGASCSGLRCTTGNSCVASGESEICTPDGSSEAACLTTTPACDAGLVCDTIAGICRTQMAVGGDCSDTQATICAPGSLCLAVSPDAATVLVCVTDGGLNAGCRSTAPPCDAGLACGGTTCLPAATLGMPCDLRGQTTACVAGTTCVQSGTAATCIVDGASGAGCSVLAPACAPGLICGSTSNDTFGCHVAQ
jgi:hypothetical protein